MKQIYIYILCLLLTVALHAEKGPKLSAGKVTAGGVRFKFSNLMQGVTPKDSVLIIFDRCDRTGAGVIYQVFYADQDHNITIPAVPSGKYFVTIQCLGLHRDRLEKIIRIKSQKSEQVKINLAECEEFAKDKVVIPAYQPNLANLAAFKTR
jgi:hypothetical protein